MCSTSKLDSKSCKKRSFMQIQRKVFSLQTSFIFLGHIIDDQVIHPTPEKIRTIMEWIRPENKKELERFNGIVNYVSQFLPHIATITAPLTELTGKAE